MIVLKMTSLYICMKLNAYETEKGGKKSGVHPTHFYTNNNSAIFMIEWDRMELV